MMSNAWTPPSELISIAETACRGVLDESQTDRLATILCDQRACRWYRDYCLLHVELRFLALADRIDAEARAVTLDESDVEAQAPSAELPPSYVVVDPSAGSAFSASQFSLGGLLLSYAVSALIIGVAVLGAWTYKIPYVDRLAQSLPTPEKKTTYPSNQVFVGCITGMKDCRWAKPNTQTVLGASVPLEREYALSSGWMEITYISGAKVILEGPCTFKVDSNAGGFLERGKLTARMETKAEVGSRKSERNVHHNNSAFRLPPSAFVVKTPAAIVTDLGTEFGVEANPDGVTITHVLEGRVKVEVFDGTGRKNQVIELDAGKSMRVSKSKDDQAATISFGNADYAAFPIRPGTLAEHAKNQWEAPFHRWLTYSHKLRKDPSLVAYYTFEARGCGLTLPNMAASGETLDGHINGARWATGRFPSKFALRFYGAGFRDRVELPEPGQFNFAGSFTLAAWLKPEPSNEIYRHVISRGESDWKLTVKCDERMKNIVFTTGVIPENGEFNSLGKRDPYRTKSDHWSFVVGVVEADGETATKRLYVDGQLEMEQRGLPQRRFASGIPVWLGDNAERDSGGPYCGLIDEVAIFSRALSSEEIRNMHIAGNPGEQAAAPTNEPVRLAEDEEKHSEKSGADKASDSKAATTVLGGVTVFRGRAAFNAAVSDTAVCSFSGLTSNGSYKRVGRVRKNGITIVGKGLTAVNNTLEHTGKEVLDLRNGEALLTFPGGTTAVGMEFYIKQSRRVKFTATYSDGTVRDFTTPVQTVPNPFGRSPSFWGIASLNPIVSLKIWEDDIDQGIGTPVIDWVAAGAFASEPEDARLHKGPTDIQERGSDNEHSNQPNKSNANQNQ